MHRDIKPGNILFDEDMTLKIADFGLGVQSSRGRLCRGTLRYMAPELIESKDAYDQSVDLWSAGVLV
jgi:serine/threonine protein kinase